VFYCWVMVASHYTGRAKVVRAVRLLICALAPLGCTEPEPEPAPEREPFSCLGRENPLADALAPTWELEHLDVFVSEDPRRTRAIRRARQR